MGNNAKAEQINVKEYMKARWKKVFKAVADTFKTLGEMLIVTSDTNKLTDADIEAAEIWKAHPKAKKAVEALEAREEIPEEVEIQAETKKRKPRYEIHGQIATQEPVQGISKGESKDITMQEPGKGKTRGKAKMRDDDYVK